MAKPHEIWCSGMKKAGPQAGSDHEKAGAQAGSDDEKAGPQAGSWGLRPVSALVRGRPG
jgi:hypothetical protein